MYNKARKNLSLVKTYIPYLKLSLDGMHYWKQIKQKMNTATRSIEANSMKINMLKEG